MTKTLLGLISLLAALLSPRIVLSQVNQGSPCQRVISLAPSITEILFALGLGDKVVAITRYCNFPQKVISLPRLGGLFDTNLEAAALLSPSLIVGLPESQSVLDQFNKMGLATLAVSDRSVEKIFQTFEIICKRCGCESEGLKLRQQIEDQIAPLIAARSTSPRLQVAVVVASAIGSGVQELYLSGSDGYYSSLLNLLNFENVYENRTAALPSSSIETLAVLNPSVVFVVEADDTQFKELQRTLSVYLPRTHVVQLKQSFAVVPGPRFPLLMQALLNGLDESTKDNP